MLCLVLRRIIQISGDNGSNLNNYGLINWLSGLYKEVLEHSTQLREKTELEVQHDSLCPNHAANIVGNIVALSLSLSLSLSLACFRACMLSAPRNPRYY